METIKPVMNVRSPQQVGTSHFTRAVFQIDNFEEDEYTQCAESVDKFTDGLEVEDIDDKNKQTVPKGMKRNLSRSEVPLLFREPHVEFGFRPLHQPWSYYIMSIFSLHNESMNVWTHLVALILTIWKLHNYSYELDFWNDAYTWPFLTGMICGIYMYLCSAAAHCCQSKSELVHYVSFMIDYSGIGLYGFGSVVLHLMYCSEDNFFYFVQHFFIPVGGLFAFLICYCCSIAKVMFTRPYPFARKVWQILPVMAIYIILVSPIIHRLFTCYIYKEDCNESIPYHVQQIMLFLLSGFFFASDIPQKWHPGKCDYFLHSHQLFHIAIALCIYTQMDGVMIDFKSREAIIRSRPEPTFSTSFLPLIIVITIEVLCVLYFTIKVSKTLSDAKSNSSDKKKN